METLKQKDCWYREVCSEAPHGCTATCVRFAEMLNLMQMSNLPKYRWFPEPLYADKDINAFRELKAIKDDIKNWVKEGNSLYLYSESFGNGKTSWAVNLMLASTKFGEVTVLGLAAFLSLYLSSLTESVCEWTIRMTSSSAFEIVCLTQTLSSGTTCPSSG